ncbi:MAG: cobyrinic acid a,c-diamide synthase, partial [Chloroflexota bacterium]|nr:cobyrinic acid a,c-diamide synthase [Chloroflexota bacterium]
VQQWYDALIAQVEESIDLDRILELASGTSPEMEDPQVYPAEPQPRRARIAVAQDKAFSFYYQDSLDLLEAWGAELVPFSPLTDREVPRGVGGIYIGGGFPEMFAEELSGNTPMLESMRDALKREVPVYAECGGLMYLGQSLSDLDGNDFPMVGALPVISSMSNRRLTLGYREVEAREDTPLLRKGQRVRGHEFHWSVLAEQPRPEQSVYRVVNQDNRPEGFQVGSIWASYIHIHLGSSPGLARRFIDTCVVE